MDEQIIMEEAKYLKREGRLAEARTLYHQVIDAIPQCDPAYKGLAKVEIGDRNYEAAIQAILMKIDLAIFFSLQVPDSQLRFMWTQAINKLHCSPFIESVQIGPWSWDAYSIGHYISLGEPIALNVALLAWAEPDIYFYLGHCLARLFPNAFSHYNIPERMLVNFENALLGHSTGCDARDDSRYAPPLYIIGFMFAFANCSPQMESITPSIIRARFNRTLDFLRLGD